MDIEHALFSSDTLLEILKAPTNFASFWRQIEVLLVLKTDRVNTLKMTFRHSHHKNETLKSDRVNACFQFLEPKIESLQTNRVNGPLKPSPTWHRKQNSRSLTNAGMSLRPGVHLQQTPRPKKQSDYVLEQLYFPLIALFWPKIGRCRGRNPGGGHFHINLYVTCRFSGYHFSAGIPERGTKLIRNSETGYDYLFTNKRILFSRTIGYCFPIVL